MFKVKVSTHFRAAFTAAAVVFVGTLVKQPQMVTWIQAHWIVSDIITAGSAAYAIYLTYAQPLEIPDPTQKEG